MKLLLTEKPFIGKYLADILGAKKDIYSSFYKNKEYIIAWNLGKMIGYIEPYNKQSFKKDNYEKSFDKLDLHKIEDTVVITTKKHLQSLKDIVSSVTEIVLFNTTGYKGLYSQWLVAEYINDNKIINVVKIKSLDKKYLIENINKTCDISKIKNQLLLAKQKEKTDIILNSYISNIYNREYKELLVGIIDTPILNIIKSNFKNEKNYLAEYYELYINVEGFNLLYKNSKENKHFDKEDLLLIKESLHLYEKRFKFSTPAMKIKNTPYLYDLESIVIDANRVYKYNANETIYALLSLYEKHRLITYPITDVKTCPLENCDNYYNKLISKIEEVKGIKIEKNIVNKKLFSEDEKESGITITSNYSEESFLKLSLKEINLLNLIVDRMIVSVMKRIVYRQYQVSFYEADKSFTQEYNQIIDHGYSKGVCYLTDLHRELYEFKCYEEEPLKKIQNLRLEDASIDIVTKNININEECNTINLYKIISKKYKDIINKKISNADLIVTLNNVILSLYKNELIDSSSTNIFVSKKGENLLELLPKCMYEVPYLRELYNPLLKILNQGLSIDEYTEILSKYLQDIKEEISIKDNTFISPINKVSLGRCIYCGGAVYEEKTMFACENSKIDINPCTFVISKVDNKIANATDKLLTSIEMKKLLLPGGLTIKTKNGKSNYKISTRYNLKKLEVDIIEAVIKKSK